MVHFARTIAMSLSTGVKHESKYAIAMEDLVVIALFSPSNPASSPPHIPQTLGTAFESPGEALVNLYEVFESHKRLFDMKSPTSFMETASTIRMKLVRNREMPHFRHLQQGALSALQWCIAAYALSIHPDSSIHLKKLAMGPDRTWGFGLVATRRICKGSTLWEALGMCPGDFSASHSELSCITIAKGQNQPAGAKRVMYGPLRMVNHRCRSFNAEFAFIKNTSAFVAEALADIEAGEEITVNYGGDWFGDSCPCGDCRPMDRRTPALPSAEPVASTAESSMRSRTLLLQQRRRSTPERLEGGSKRGLEEAEAAERAKKSERQRNKRRKVRHYRSRNLESITDVV